MLSEKDVVDLDKLTEGMKPQAAEPYRGSTSGPSAATDRVQLQLGRNGYESPPDPRIRGPQATVDRKRPPGADRMCMKARKLEVVSDGTLEGTRVVVDGVQIQGITRFELIASRGFPRVTAVATMSCQHMNIPEYGENAGKEIKDGVQSSVTADVFRRS